MNALVALWQKEPALILGLLTALISVAVGLGLNQDTAGLITAAVAALSSVVVRSRVTPSP